jgi:hypothetical protein
VSRRTDQDAASLWLTRRNNPHASIGEIREAMGWSDRTFWRRCNNLSLPDYNLQALIFALETELRTEDLADPDVRIHWYRRVHDLLMIGTPPWGPNDFVDVDENLRITVPKRATINTYEKGTHAVGT